jgi:hypothetical protein
MILTNIASRFSTDWTDFIVKDQENIDTEINLNDISASDTIKLVTLNMSRYNGYDGFGYDVGTAERGITEQEAYDIWIKDFQTNQRTFIKQLQTLNIKSIAQCVFDGLLLYFIINGNILTVTAPEGTYELRNYVVEKDWSTVASMIKRSNFNKVFCLRAASIIKLADYGKNKDRAWMRQTGIFEMRDKNELNSLTLEQLARARFAYYAETLRFLPKTPEGIKRGIAKEYEKTLVIENYTYSTTKVFTLLQTPSMEPVEKLKVEINGEQIQHYFDFTITNNVVTITKDLTAGDIIRFTIKI